MFAEQGGGGAAVNVAQVFAVVRPALQLFLPFLRQTEVGQGGGEHIVAQGEVGGVVGNG